MIIRDRCCICERTGGRRVSSGRLIDGGCLGVEVGAQVVPRCRDEPHHSSCYPSGSRRRHVTNETTVRTARLPGAT